MSVKLGPGIVRPFSHSIPGIPKVEVLTVIGAQGDMRFRIVAQGQDTYAFSAPIIREAALLSRDIRAKPPAG
ncbi:hypothetical protein C9413_17525 [Rhizobium sp. SEMIA 4085]|uniref:Uncharacterized protein n=1 Tax=Rhizobium gallicum bv. gallicum R602sp TaxID=1041138 RepID=A0A0B4X7E4_9HYPH|nr:hypothetical protein RGR602_CH03787 [Rhizobium gallicum bv. gallicum R602sp]NNH31241.1 hypothetical protein [Rhizobium sp. SEMIA 4085]